MYKKTVTRKSVAKKELGFSLIDLLFSLALSGILLSLAFPAYERVRVEIRLLTLTEQITSVLNYARSEAIKHRSIVFLCPSENGKACSSQWHDGWIVVLGRYTTFFAEKNLLRAYPPLFENESLKWRGAVGRNYVQLNPDGSAYGHNGSFIVCVKALTTRKVWSIKVSATGRIKIDKHVAIDLQ